MKKMLIAGIACLSVVAVAQTTGTGTTASNHAKTSVSREAASGQASGKQAQGSKPAGRESSAPSVSEAVAKAPSGGGQVRVATGDLNGDGHADLTATSGSSSGKRQNTRDVSSGQASGKRQHQPLTIRKSVDAASPKL